MDWLYGYGINYINSVQKINKHLDKFFKIGIAVLIGIEVFVMNTPSIDAVILLGLKEKIAVFLGQSVYHTGIFYLVLRVFLKNTKDSLYIKLSFVFFILILSFGSLRIFVSLFNLSSDETWVIRLTQWYHFLRSPNVFAVIIPLLIVRKQVVSNPNET